MANGEHIEVAKAYVTIVPSLEGSQATISKELTDVTSEASEQAGKEGGSKFGNKFATALKGTAAGIGAAVAAVTAAAVASGKAFIDAASDVSVYGNEIDKNSQKMGISAAAYQEWDFIMQHAGSSIEGMKSSMLKLTKAAEGSNAAFEALGISQEELDSLSQEELFSRTITALQNVQDESQRTILTNDLLGKSAAVELAPLLNMTAEETEALRSQVYELGGVMSDEAVKASAGFQDSLQNMNTALDGMKNNMMSNFLPSMSTVMDGLADIFSNNDIDAGLAKIEQGVKSLADKLVAKAPEFFQVGASIISALVTSIGSNLPMLIEAAVPIIGQLVTTIVEMIPTIIEAAVTLITSVLDWLVNGEGLMTIINGIVELTISVTNAIAQNIGTIIPMVVQGILQVIQALTSPEVAIPMLQAGITLLLELVKGILSAIPMLVEALPTIIQTIVTTLVESIPLIIEAAISLFMAIVDAIPIIIESLVQALPDIINTIIDGLLNAIPLLLEGAIQFLMAIIQAIPTIILTLVQELPRIITTIIETLLSRLPDLIIGAVQLFMGIIQAIPQIIVELVKNLPQIIVCIVKGLISGIGEIAKAGLQLIKGLWEGIKNAASWIWEKIKGFCSGIVDKIKGFFGIHSPSTVFASIGDNLALGLGEGWEDGMDDVQADMVDSMEDLTGNMTASITANSDINGGLGGDNTTINGGAITINVYAAEGQDVNSLAETVATRLGEMTSRKGLVYA